MDGGAASSQPSTMTQTSIPEYANPYVRAMLGQAMKTVFNVQPHSGAPVKMAEGGPIVSQGTDMYATEGPEGATYHNMVNGQIPSANGSSTSSVPGSAPDSTVNGFDILGMKPMETYTGLGAADYRVAPLSPLQQQAANAVGGMTTNIGNAQEMIAPYDAARSAAMSVGDQAKQASQFAPGQFGVNYQAGNFSPDYQQGQFDTKSITDPNALDAYMSPYMQKVVDINKREAIRDASKQNLLNQAQATQAGAFGGGRDALMRTENLRNMNQHLGDIQDTGNQAAYQAGIGQFNTEAGQRFAAQQAREQAKQFGTSASMNAQQLGEQSRQFGAGLDMQSQQMGEQSRQFGSGLQMQGLQQQLSAAVAAGQMTQAEADQRLRAGQQTFEQQAGIATLQSQMGGQQQQNQQQQINNAYGDFVNQQNYPYKQLGFLSDMLRGLPLANVSTYQAPPSAVSQIAGLGTAGIAGLGLYNATK